MPSSSAGAGTTPTAPVTGSTSASRAACPVPALRKTASRVPSGEKAPPMAKPPGSGLRTVLVASVAVLVILTGQFPGSRHAAGIQARRL